VIIRIKASVFRGLSERLAACGFFSSACLFFAHGNIFFTFSFRFAFSTSALPTADTIVFMLFVITFAAAAFRRLDLFPADSPRTSAFRRRHPAAPGRLARLRPDGSGPPSADISRHQPPFRPPHPRLSEKMAINLYKRRNVVYLRCCSAGRVPAQRLRSGRRKAESHTHILTLYARHTGA